MPSCKKIILMSCNNEKYAKLTGMSVVFFSVLLFPVVGIKILHTRYLFMTVTTSSYTFICMTTDSSSFDTDKHYSNEVNAKNQTS